MNSTPMQKKDVRATRTGMAGKVLLAVAALWFGVTSVAPAQDAAPVSPKTLVVNIDAGQTAEPVSKYEYGMFIEHIGELIYRSLWSEMLDDRKFYFPIEAEQSVMPAHLPPGPFRGMMPRKWYTVGPAGDVVMDTDHPFVGDHSPRISLEGATPHGIRQSGLSLEKGKHYVGHVWLRGTPGAKVRVMLAWGADAKDRQTVMMGPLTAAYKRIALRFEAQATTNKGTLEITGTGTGDFHIGTLSLMPADNIDGFRPDTIELLRKLHSGFWRLPGGNFISDFSWYDSVGDRDRRPPIFDYAWHAAQQNDVGMDELMTFCKLIGVEPYITVNAGFGDAHSAMEEVEYMNGSVRTRLGAERARNGHPEPYHVKFWDIGNEPYGPWQLGRTDLKYYVLKHNEFAKAMRKADPSITLLGSGSMPEEAVIESTGAPELSVQEEAKFCSKVDWTCGLLKNSWGNFQGITEHWYERAGVRFDLENAEKGIRFHNMEAGYMPMKPSVLEWVRKPSDRVRLKAEEWEHYEQMFPAMKQKKIFLSIDEYAYTGGPPNLKMALAYAMVFDEMLRHTGYLRMSAFTMGISTMDITPTDSVLNTNGLLFELYGKHFGAGSIPVELTGNSPQPAPTEHLVGDLPRTSAGSPTYPLDMFAALSPDGKFLNVAVVNATDTAQDFALHVNGVKLGGKATLWRMTGKDLDAANRVGQPAQVAVKEMELGNVPQMVSVAPISVNIYRFPVTGTTK